MGNGKQKQEIETFSEEIKRLQKFGNDENCLAILMTHDTEMKTKIFEL